MVALSEETKKTLDSILEQAVSEGKVPGASIVVGSSDQELYFGAAGVKSFGEPSAGNIDKNSVFWVCSHTKLVVTIAILQLIEEGKLTYNTPATKFFPELVDPIVLDSPLDRTSTYSPAKNEILVKHLLNHSSGITYSTLDKRTPDELNPAYTSVAYKGSGVYRLEKYSREEFFRLVRRGYPSVPLSFEPGTDWAYGYGCDLIVFIVEEITGKPIQEYCQERIFGPLGITPTFYIDPRTRSDLVQLTYRSRTNGAFEKWEDQLSIPEREKEKMGITLGGIALHSTLSDYLVILQHLLLIKSGRSPPNAILTPETVSLMFTPSLPPNATDAIYRFTSLEETYPRVVELNFGLGVCLANEDWDGRKKAGTGFWYGWAGTYYFVDPATGIAVVYGTQLVPTFDSEVIKLWDSLERAIYTGLGK